MSKDNTKQEEELVQIPRSELSAILKRLEAVENPGLIDLDAPKKHVVNVRLYEDKPISKLWNPIVSGRDPVTGDQTMSCQIEVIDGDKKVQTVADYLGILRDAEIVKAELIETIQTDISPEPVGKVSVKTLEGYNMVATGILVPLRVKTFKTTYLVKMPDGKELNLEMVNI